MSIRKGNTIIAGAGSLTTKANVSLDNLDPTGQAVLNAKANNNDTVHKTGDEIITGIKTITVSGTSTALRIKNPGSTADVVPTENSGRFLEFVDKNGVKEGYLEFYHASPSGTKYIAMNINKDAGQTVAGQIAVCLNNQNEVYTYAPTPAVSSNDHNIATTAWVKSVAGVGVVAYQHPTAANGYTWYRKYADGWVEQGGILTQAANTSFTATITFPIAMADNNYCILFAGRGSNNTTAGNFAGVQYTNETTTSVGVYVGNDNTRYTKLCWQVSGVAK